MYLLNTVALLIVREAGRQNAGVRWEERVHDLLKSGGARPPGDGDTGEGEI